MAGWDEGNRIMEELADERASAEERAMLEGKLGQLQAEVAQERAKREATDRVLTLADEFLHEDEEHNPKRLRDAIERLRTPPEETALLAPAESPAEWTARMRLEAALGQAVQLAVNRPDLVRPADKLEGADRAIDLAQRVAAMAKVFDTLLKGG